MTTFLDGPAKGQTLMLKRGPYFLRVVTDGKKWDALDQLDDTAVPGEQIFVYVMEGIPSRMHLNARGGRGGFFVSATYKLAPNQPKDGEVRKIDDWAVWCQHNKPANKKFTDDYLDKSA